MRAPTDFQKPPVPYIKGWKFTAQSHISPPPTPVTRGCCQNKAKGRKERSTLNQVKRCLKHPPLLGKTEPYTTDLEILDLLRVGDGYNAQVFTVNIFGTQSLSTGSYFQLVVAKTYDLLYYNEDEGYLNPFLCVDRNYTHEVHAYNLLTEFQGDLVPKFF